jgi:hypothetical protein
VHQAAAAARVDDRDPLLLGSAEEGAAPLLFAPPSGVFRADTGEKVDARATYGGYAWKDGAWATIGSEKGEGMFVLRRGRRNTDWTSDKRFMDRAILYENRVAILWDHIVYASGGELSVQRILDGDIPTSPRKPSARFRS